MSRQRQRVITPDNYRDFKPSEFVHSFVSDIEVAERLGKPMDLSDWWANGNCLPCLGGMACMNWGIGPNKAEGGDIGDMTSGLGDNIRKGQGSGVENYLKDLYPTIHIDEELPKLLSPMCGTVRTPEQFTRLKERVMVYVRALEAQGL